MLKFANKLKKLHIVSLSIPYPPDYGGVIDIFYKIKSLHNKGVCICLHAFQYDRPIAKELEKYCEEVHYYQRKTGLPSWFSSEPYIVRSRRIGALKKRLQADDAPILFEGVHCSAFAPLLSQERTVFIRSHNIEHHYYHALFKREKHPVKKLFYYTEYRKLKHYQQQLKTLHHLAISASDAEILTEMGIVNTLVPAFHGIGQVYSKPGTGTYCLYHGNLSVNENIEAAQFLIKEMHFTPSFPLIIAGKSPEHKLRQLISQKTECIKLIANPDAQTMQQLIGEAQLHLLPTWQPTGLKLKLLQALFNGRHVLVSPQMLSHPALQKGCITALNTRQWQDLIEKYSTVPFTQTDLTERRKLLNQYFCDEKSAEKILHLLER